MGRSGEAIDAAVLASAVWIHAGLEANVGAVVPCDNCLGSIPEELCLGSRLILFLRRIHLNDIEIGQIDMKFFESIGRIPGSASPVDRGRGWRRLFDYGHELFCPF